MAGDHESVWRPSPVTSVWGRDTGAAPTALEQLFGMSLDGAAHDAPRGDDPGGGVPPTGRHWVASEHGRVTVIFNAGDARRWWHEHPHVAFAAIVREMFPGAAEDVVDACERAIGVGPVAPPEPRDRTVAFVFDASVQAQVVAWFAQHQPSLKLHPVVERGGAPAERASSRRLPARVRPGGPAPEVASPELERLRELYAHLRGAYGDHPVFARDGATYEDLLQFHAAEPAAFAPLRTPAANNDRATCERFLDGWIAARGRSGDARGAAGGVEGGVPTFAPRADLEIEQRPSSYVVGSELRARVRFANDDRDHQELNRNLHRVRCAFRLIDRATGRVVDSGPWIEEPGVLTWRPSLPTRPGRYFVRVAVKSGYFKPGAAPVLESDDVAVVAERTRGREVFDRAHVGRDRSFTRGRDGKLAANAGAPVRDVGDELVVIRARLGALRALAERGELDLGEVEQYRERFEAQAKGLEAWDERLHENGAQPYLVRGTFVSRETSAPLELQLVMTGGRTARGYRVQALDATLDPGNPVHHPGTAIEEAAPRDFARLERRAVRAMAEHFHEYNDFPPGKLQLAVQLHEGREVLELEPIETTSARRTAKQLLSSVAMVGGVAALVASPFTGGSTALVGLVILSSAASMAATTMDLLERRAKEGELKIDGRLVLDVASLASNAVGLGAMTRGVRALSWGARTMYFGGATALDAAQGVLLAAEVREAILGIDAEYTLKIGAATGTEEKERLRRERDGVVAELLGHAALSGLFLAVSIRGNALATAAAHQSGVQYRVGEAIVALAERGDAREIRERLDRGALSFEERAYLEELLATPRGEVQPRVEARPDGEMVRTADHAGGEFHNHLMGVADVAYFVDGAAGEGNVFTLFERCHAILAADEKLRKASPHTWRIAQRAQEQLAELDRSGAPLADKQNLLEEHLRKMLAASDEGPFDESYDLREELVKRYIDPGGGPFKNYARDSMRQLVEDGVSYSEQSASPKKILERFPEDTMRQARSELQAEGVDTDVRFLAMIPTKLFGSKGTDADFNNFMTLLRKVLARGDVIGIDVAGPEVHAFTPDGKKRFREVYATVSAAAKARGRALVYRPHVGEGYAARGDDGHLDADDGHKKLARKNLEALIETLEEIGYSPSRAEEDGVIVRFGHAAHATPEMIQRMAKMGVIAVGSSRVDLQACKLEYSIVSPK